MHITVDLLDYSNNSSIRRKKARFSLKIQETQRQAKPTLLARIPVAVYFSCSERISEFQAQVDQPLVYTEGRTS